MWSMSMVDNELIDKNLKSCVIGQIHDSVIVDTHPSETEVVCEILYKIMVTEANNIFNFLKIPLEIDIEIGKNWSVLKKR